MHTPANNLNTLFAQLGLKDDDESIDRFIRANGPIPARTPLHDAPCWNQGQAALLQEAVADDSDWTEVVDQLDALLRKTPE